MVLQIVMRHHHPEGTMFSIIDVTEGEEFTCILFLFWNMLPQLCWHVSSLSGVGSSPMPIPSLVDQYHGLWHTEPQNDLQIGAMGAAPCLSVRAPGVFPF